MFSFSLGTSPLIILFFFSSDQSLQLKFKSINLPAESTPLFLRYVATLKSVYNGHCQSLSKQATYIALCNSQWSCPNNHIPPCIRRPSLYTNNLVRSWRWPLYRWISLYIHSQCNIYKFIAPCVNCFFKKLCWYMHRNVVFAHNIYRSFLMEKRWFQPWYSLLKSYWGIQFLLYLIDLVKCFYSKRTSIWRV